MFDNIIETIRSMSIIKKFILSYLVIVMVPFLLISIVFYNTFLQQSLENYNEIFEYQLENISVSIEKNLTSLEQIAKTIEGEAALTEYLTYYAINPNYYDFQIIKYIGAFLESITEINPQINSIQIFPFDSKVMRYRTIILDKKYFIDYRGEDQFYGLPKYSGFWSPAHEESAVSGFLGDLSLDPAERVFSLYKYMYTKDKSKEIAFLELSIKESDLLGNIESSLSEDSNIYIYALDSQNEIIMSTTNTSAINIDISELQIDRADNISLVELSNRRFLISTLTIEKLDIRFVLLYPYSQIRSLVYDRMATIVLIVIVSLASIFIISFLISKLIFKRMNRLIKKMEKVRKEDFDVIIDIGPPDEVGRLEIVFSTMLDKIKNLIRTVYQTKLAEKEAVIAYLQAQMNPHFLLNTIESIRMMAEVDKNNRVSEGLFSMGKIIKAHLNEKTFSTLKEEIEVAASYINIQNIRGNNDIQLETRMAEGIEYITIPSLIIQPMVENSIIHGFKNRVDVNSISISAKICDDNKNLIIQVCDNGIGIRPDELTKMQAGFKKELIKKSSNDDTGTHGIALSNVNERLRLYYGESYYINITSEHDKGTVVEIKIPV